MRQLPGAARKPDAWDEVTCSSCLAKIETQPRRPKEDSIDATWQLWGSAAFGATITLGLWLWGIPAMKLEVQERNAELLTTNPDDLNAGLGLLRIAVYGGYAFAALGVILAVISSYEALCRIEPIRPAMEEMARGLGAIGKGVAFVVLVVAAVLISVWVFTEGGCDGELVPVNRFGDYECIEYP